MAHYGNEDVGHLAQKMRRSQHGNHGDKNAKDGPIVGSYDQVVGSLS